MERSVWQQIRDLLERESTIYLLLPKHPSTDAIASGLALFLFLEKMGKKATVVSDEFQLPENHAFLPRSSEIQQRLESGNRFTITVHLTHAQVQELSYTVNGDKLHIYLIPKNGQFTKEDVTATDGAEHKALFITLDAPDLESLGGVYDANTDLFYTTPIINIDHRAANTNYGQVNLVELTATSTSEILFHLIQEIDEKLLDEHIATNLLAGIISKTKSFQSATVTPKSLAVASHLIASGARREEIIRHLYQTKSLQTLRLWGRVLAQLKTDHQERFVWSRVRREDLAPFEHRADALTGVIDELIIDTPKAEIIALLYESADGKPKALLSTLPMLNSLTLFREFQPQAAKEFLILSFPVASLDDAERLLTEKVAEHYRTP